MRRLGALIETVHAVVYFAPEPAAAYAELGLRGYWRGYFASRAAALGPVGPGLVTALFAGFAPRMVARAVPAVWSVAEPTAVARVRATAAASALHRLVGDDLVTVVQSAADLTGRCLDALPVAGRPMAAAVRDLPRPAEPFAALWQDCTVLREFRGDAHIAVVTAAGLSWPEPHLLRAETLDPRQQEYRGWTDQEWAEACERVRIVDPETLERDTDRLAAPAFGCLHDAEVHALIPALTTIATRAARGVPYPNAMGLRPL